MKISYNKLWKLLIDKGITKTDLRIKLNMSTATLAKMNKCEPIATSILLQICDILDTKIEYIIETIKNEENENAETMSALNIKKGYEMNIEKAIEKAKEIAKEGTTEEKENFVKWACETIDYLNKQIANNCATDDMKKGLENVRAQYYAYLMELTK